MNMFCEITLKGRGNLPSTCVLLQTERITKLSRLGFTHLVSCPITVSCRRTIPVAPPAPFKAVPRWKLIRPLPSDFPHIEEESESLGIVQEPEPIRSLGLWTPLQDLVFRDSTYLV